jgi:hypothetical protein
MKKCIKCGSTAIKTVKFEGTEAYNCTACDTLSNYCEEIAEDDFDIVKYHYPFNNTVGSIALTIGDIKGLDLPDDYEITFDDFYGRSDKADVRIDHISKKISIN